MFFNISNFHIEFLNLNRKFVFYVDFKCNCISFLTHHFLVRIFSLPFSPPSLQY